MGLQYQKRVVKDKLGLLVQRHIDQVTIQVFILLVSYFLPYNSLQPLSLYQLSFLVYPLLSTLAIIDHSLPAYPMGYILFYGHYLLTNLYPLIFNFHHLDLCYLPTIFSFILQFNIILAIPGTLSLPSFIPIHT